ncbi:MAG: hypothetical protein Q7K40_04155 [bacterium]|nr:hypothetical protein [bacterium]
MIRTITRLFRLKRAPEYAGLSDFLLRASSDEKKKIITEAARRANEDQYKVFTKAQLKVGTN